MKLKILTLDNKEIGKKELPKQFNEAVRPDLIKRDIEALQANARQSYGASPGAGKRHSAVLSRRRHKYRGAYGYGISRVPRKILSRRGERLNWVGAVAPGTVGGRRAHPPKAAKFWNKKMNKKEKRKAIRSAIAATVSLELVKARGHKVPDNYPFIIEKSFENTEKTKDVKKTLETLGFKEELKRTEKKKIRAGKGKTRGRKYKTKKGILIVTAGDCKIVNAGKGITGIDIANVNSLNTELLAPGCVSGRLTIWTEQAIDKMEKESLFK